MHWERMSGSTDLIFRKEMEHFLGMWGEGSGAEKRMQ